MRDRESGARWASTLHERLDLHPQARRATREFNPPQAIWDAVLRALEKGTDRCALVTTLVDRFASVVCLGNLQQSWEAEEAHPHVQCGGLGPTWRVMNIEVLHARQEGNEKQFRPHIRAHGQLVVVDVGFEGLEVCGHDAAQCSVGGINVLTTRTKNRPPNSDGH